MAVNKKLVVVGLTLVIIVASFIKMKISWFLEVSSASAFSKVIVPSEFERMYAKFSDITTSLISNSSSKSN